MKKIPVPVVRCLLANAVVAIAAVTCSAQAWKTGAEFQRLAGNPGLQVSWLAAPLANEVRIASQALGLAVFADRRIDPGQQITMQVDQISFEQVLWRVADQNDSAVVRLEDIFYLGPAASAAQLQNSVVELTERIRNRRIPAATRRALEKRIEWVQAEPFEPAAEIRRILDGSQLDVQGTGRIPHDFWRPVHLPEMSVAQLINLMLAGFDLRLVIRDDGQLEIVPVDLTAPTTYWLAASESKDVTPGWIRQSPGITAVKSSGQLGIRGAPEAVIQAVRRIAHRSAVVNDDRPPGKTLLSLHTSARRGDIVATIANQLKLKTAFAPDCQAGLEQIVEIEIQNATPAELLQAALKGSGLGFRITDGAVEVFRKDPQSR